MTFSERVTGLAPEGAYHMLARAQALEAQGREIIHLEIGQPDAPTFPPIIDAAVRALHAGHTRYTPPAGLLELRQAIASHAGRQRGLDLTPDRVVVGPGAKPALFFPTLALVRPGDEVIIPDPGFPTYAAMVQVAGGIPIRVRLSEADDFAFDPNAFRQALSPQTRLIVINSPGNPTGGLLTLEALELVAQAALTLDCWVLSDEIYSRLIYNPQPPPSIAALPGMLERTVICDGFSKTYAMTGWRLGFGLMPPALAERVELLLTHSVGCTAAFTQFAGIEALRLPDQPLMQVAAEYRRRRDALVGGLNAISGISCRTPGGAFYAFPNVKALGRPSAWLADYLLDECGVAVLPGSDFGPGGEGYLRLSFATSQEQIAAALDRLAAGLLRLS
jgi:aspartate aminotransferase